MSRVDEALKRARVREQIAGSTPAQAENLDDFHRFAERDVAESERPEAPAASVPLPRLTAFERPASAVPPAGSADRADACLGADAADITWPTHEKLVVSPALQPVVVEQYRRLAATLHQLQQDRGTRTMMVASALTGEGKTLTATNLALTLSESYGRSVLLIDADLRRPMLHEVFQAGPVGGLSEGLRSESAPRLSLVALSPRLSLLPAGSADPSPLAGLTSDRMRLLIQEGSTRFDWVILDTPPVILLPDASLLGAMVDVAVFVIGARSTPHALIQQAITAIGRDRIVGIVLNRVEDDVVAGGRKYRDYYARGVNA